MAMVYHGVSIADGGDSAIQNEATWIADWVSLLQEVQQSDACEVGLTQLPVFAFGSARQSLTM